MVYVMEPVDMTQSKNSYSLFGAIRHLMQGAGK